MKDYQEVLFDSWKRKEVFNFFKDYQDPYFNVTVNIEVSGLWHFCKEHKTSFFLASLFSACKVANEIPEMKVRMLGEELRAYKLVHPGCTILKEDNSFGFAYFTMKDTLVDFVAEGQKEIDRVKSLKNMGVNDEQVNVIYFSVLPWMSFTSFKNARMDNALNGIPKIVFGKVFKEKENTFKMPISIEVHHSFLDGFHVGAFINQLEAFARLASF